MTESLRLLPENLEGAHRTAARLGRSLGKVTARSPFTAQMVAGLDPDQQDTVDAFLKRFEQLADLVGLALFKGLAILEQEDVAHLSRRDLADLMEKLGIIPSAEDWSRVAVLRNRLAHGYPNDPVPSPGPCCRSRSDHSSGQAKTIATALTPVGGAPIVAWWRAPRSAWAVR